MSKEQLEFILQVSAENPPPQDAGPAEMRAWFEAINAETPIVEGATYEDFTIGQCSAELISFPDTGKNRSTGENKSTDNNKSTDKTKLLIYYHGGGFFFGSPRSHRVITTNLARMTGFSVLSVDYRLAPEHPAPTSHDDAFEVYGWALKQGYPASAIALAGDSAGGNLSLSVAVRARDADLPVPGCLVLMSPALDLAGDGDSHRTEVDAPLLTPEMMGLFNALYIGDRDRRSTLVTPFHADMAGLPPALIHVGSWEILRDDSITIAERINSAGGSAELKVWDGMCHCWQLFAPMLDEGMASLEESAAFLKQHLISP